MHYNRRGRRLYFLLGVFAVLLCLVFVYFMIHFALLGALPNFPAQKAEKWFWISVLGVLLSGSMLLICIYLAKQRHNQNR